MHQRLFILLIAALVFGPGLGYGQMAPNPGCGTDQVMARQPALDSLYRQLARQLRTVPLTDKTGSKARKADNATLYTIPVVFIVYHLGEAVGTESNVSDAAIEAILARTNNYYRTTGTAPFLGTDARIQFALAKRTPTCPSVATSGIVRVDGRTIPAYNATNGTLTGDGAIEQGLRTATPNFPRLDADGVLVIRVVKQIGFAAGYAYFGGDVFFGSQYISTARFNSFLAHEIGHVFTLYHTFAGQVFDNGVMTCPPNNNPDIDGDQVADTEPHIEPGFTGATTCPEQQTGTNACTGQVYGPVIDNHMNYALCENTHFSPGQINRMRTALTTLFPTLLDESFLLPPVAGTGNPVLVTAACSVSVGTAPGNYAYGIFSVRLGKINHPSSYQSGPFYNDFSCFYRTSVQSGAEIQIKVGSYAAARVYIDYNNDGAFNETNELAWKSTYSARAGVLNKGTIHIPTNAVMNTYLRVRVLSDASDNPTACYLPGSPGYGYGEVEDYALQIVADTPYPPTVRHVRVGATGTGQSWADASGSLTTMLEAAQEGDTVKVATGAYYPTHNVILDPASLDPRDRTFLIPTAVLVFGGYAGTGNTPNKRTIGTSPGSTTLSGDLGTLGDSNDNAYNVVTFEQASPLTRLDGFVITAGNGNPYFAGSGIRNDGGQGPYLSNPTIANCQLINNLGGGMVNQTCGGSCHPTLLNCVFTGNVTAQNGGAMLNQPDCGGSCSPTIIDCQFVSNTATNGLGGAIYNDGVYGDCHVSLIRCLFTGNRAGYAGGAIGLSGAISTTTAPSTLTAVACQFESNTAQQGGAIYNAGSANAASPVAILFNRCWFRTNQATGGSGGAVYNNGGFAYLNTQLINCALVGNQAATGGAIYNFLYESPGSWLSLTNCTISSNAATQRGGAIYNLTSTGQIGQTATNCIVWGNTAPTDPTLADGNSPQNFLFRYSLTEGQYAGTGNLNLNPLFIDPAANNVSLSATSPALNTGDPTATTAQIGVTDLAGNPRIADGRIDMGAFESFPVLCTMFTLKPGNWTDPTVWSCGRVPLAADPIEIRHSVTVPTAQAVAAQKLRYTPGGQLILLTGASIHTGN